MQFAHASCTHLFFFFFFFGRQRKRATFHRFHLIFQAVTGERLFAIIAATSCRANWCVSFLQLGASSVAISVWTKRQSHHLIEDARVHLIYGMLHSTSAAHTHTREAGWAVLRGKRIIGQLLHFPQPAVRYRMKTLLLHQSNAIKGFREIAHAMKPSIFLSPHL